ncbi:hypothetical protein [Hydrogenophaga sp.]|uniref:hypothetical protein n=1 Tax=Hydrogenophaga sp. TaxID=1904254 RepID=UPI0025BE140B|nr:hypothetical protein [Hydrogenophaga sp.]
MSSTLHAASDATAPCDPARQISVTHEGQPLWKALLESVGIKALQPDKCRSMIAVLKMATSARVHGGSQLKTSTGVDAAQAAQEESQLRADAAVAAELASISALPDPLERTMREAALFHGKGAYSARDLRLVKARELAGTP